MASIQKRKNSWAVVYTYKTPDGKRKQKWENFNSIKAAKQRQAEIDFDIRTDNLVVPSEQTLKEYMETFISVYGTENWSPSTLGKNLSIIRNYIIPQIGDKKLQEITSLTIEKYYSELSKSLSVDQRSEKNVSSGTIMRVHKLLKTAFKTAKLWDLISTDPFDKIKTPRHEYQKREIWDTDTIIKALHLCDDPRLTMAIHLSFACSMRIGEVLGLQWKNVHISDADIADDNARVDIKCQLTSLE